MPFQGADRHAEVIADLLWSHGIVSEEAALRQRVTHTRLATYMGTSEATITRAVQVGLALGLFVEAGRPDSLQGGLGKILWLSEKGVALAPAIINYNVIDAANHHAALSGMGAVSMRLIGPGEVTVVPFSSEPWKPKERSHDSFCPTCRDEGEETSGACKRHGWASDAMWGFDVSAARGEIQK